MSPLRISGLETQGSGLKTSLRERLCRYVVRHALSMERMSWTKDGRIAYQVKYARSPTRTHLLLEPMQFLARLAALMHTLLARVYDIDSLKCPKCGGQLRMISTITEPEPIRAILESMGLPSSPPVPARARYPALFDESQLEGCDEMA